MSEQDIQVVRNLYKAIEACDAAAMGACLDEDFVLLITGQHGASGQRTKAEFIRDVPEMRKVLVGGLVYEEVFVVAHDGRVVMELKGSSTLADGSPYNNDYCYVCQIRNERILFLHEYMDSAMVEKVLLPAITNYCGK